MSVSDQGFLEAVQTVFPLFSTFFPTDAFTSLTDREKYLMIKQGKTIKLDLHENSTFQENGVADVSIKTGQNQTVHYPKEKFGFPIIVYAIPLINPQTNNIVGSFNYAISQEREQKVIDMVLELQSFAQELTASSEELAGSAQELSEQSQNVEQAIKIAEDKIKKTDSILSYTRSIADTTNLLGLNAAIEAARAGDHGRGFAVVAEEIRKLAQNSKTSSAEIAETLIEIRNNINRIFEVVNTFATISQQQAASTEQIASSGQKLIELSGKLEKISEYLL